MFQRIKFNTKNSFLILLLNYKKRALPSSIFIGINNSRPIAIYVYQFTTACVYIFIVVAIYNCTNLYS